MDFIVVCPHCGAYIGVDRHSFYDVDYYHHMGHFTANGTLHCEACDKESILEVFLDPEDYTIRKE